MSLEAYAAQIFNPHLYVCLCVACLYAYIPTWAVDLNPPPPQCVAVDLQITAYSLHIQPTLSLVIWKGPLIQAHIVPVPLSVPHPITLGRLRFFQTFTLGDCRPPGVLSS